jgi:DNA-binding CsgD family transcriptional regulator
MRESDMRKSDDHRSWTDTYTRLANEDKENPLDPDDLEVLATAAYLIGRDTRSIEALTRSYQGALDLNEIDRAVRCAFWLGMQLMNRGERAHASGWFARAQRLIDEHNADCAERGLLLVPVALQLLGKGDSDKAFSVFEEAAAIGNRFNNPDVITFSRLGRGQALIQKGDIAAGITLLDEAMVAVDAGEVSPIANGIVYCAVIETCQKIFDVLRAQEWTSALTRWCESQPELVPFRGQCLVRRAQIMHLHGDWHEAITESQRACRVLSRPPGDPAIGEAYYHLAELHRLRGEYEKAEELYLEAGKRGRKPQPGFALMRMAGGQIDAAKAAIENALAESNTITARAAVLPAYVEIMIKSNNVGNARTAVDELSAIATRFNVPYLHATASYCLGAVLLDEGDNRAALPALREAWKLWHHLDAPYEAARTRVLIGRAYRLTGDEDSAMIELNAARWIFRQLRALPDLTGVTELIPDSATAETHGLTLREVQVLRLLAEGDSNKSIAAKLFISERTVERHVSNIFNKLNVSSRTAASAFAYRQRLL